MEKQTIKDIAFWTMYIFIILLCVYLFNYIRSESYECMLDPLVYGVSKYQTNGGEFTCKCSTQSSQKMLYVTKDNSTLVDYLSLLDYNIKKENINKV